MNNNFPKFYTINNSGFGCLLTFLLVGLLLGSVGLGWVVNGFLILFFVLLLTPIVGWFVFRWWIQRNLVEDQCPVCGYEFTGFNNTECRCPSCGEAVKVEGNKFKTLTPPGTIDVEAVEVSAQALEE